MSKYIISNEAKHQNLIYDCYAVSNHFGNMGFGHYTAYAKNPQTNEWYEYDDSRVSHIHAQQVAQTVVTGAAYNLFYRRRDWHEQNMGNIDFEALAIKPDMSFI